MWVRVRVSIGVRVSIRVEVRVGVRIIIDKWCLGEGMVRVRVRVSIRVTDTHVLGHFLSWLIRGV